MHNIYTYKDTVAILGIGALIIIIAMLGPLFLSGISILFVGLSIFFSNKEINNESRKKD